MSDKYATDRELLEAVNALPEGSKEALRRLRSFAKDKGIDKVAYNDDHEALLEADFVERTNGHYVTLTDTGRAGANMVFG